MSEKDLKSTSVPDPQYRGDKFISYWTLSGRIIAMVENGRPNQQMPNQ